MRIEDRLTPEQKQLLRNLPAMETEEDREEIEREKEITEFRYAIGNEVRRKRYGRKKRDGK